MPDCGIGSITNKITGKKFIFKSTDLMQSIENHRILLNSSCHYNHELQKDWDELGLNSFSFETREITLNDETEINQRFNHHIEIVSDKYNVINSKLIIKKELDSKIEILSNKLDDITSTDDFKDKLASFNLSHNDGEIIVKTMLDQIKTDKVNYYNFDSQFDLIIREYYLIKDKNIKDNQKEELLNYLYGIIGKTSHTLIFQEKLENRNLTPDIGAAIRIELEKLIKDEKIKSSFEIDEQLNSILRREQEIKIQQEKEREALLKDQSLALDKLHSITGDLMLKPTFIYKLNSLNLSMDDGNVIKKDIEHKIKLNQLKFDEVELELNNQIEFKVKSNQQQEYDNKQNLINIVHETVGDESLNKEFIDRLNGMDLHENIGFQIQKTLLNSIETKKIKNPQEIHEKINKLLLDKEKDDVEARLNRLDKKELDEVLKFNNINSYIPLKQTKVLKLINIVPVNILKENIKSLGYDIEVSYVENPDVVYCTNCGFENTLDSTFCSECGNKLD